MQNPRANPLPALPRRQDLRLRAEIRGRTDRPLDRMEQNRAFLIAAVAATHDLLVMNHRPDLAPGFEPDAP